MTLDPIGEARDWLDANYANWRELNRSNGQSGSILEGRKIDGADFNVAAFALDADKTRINRAVGYLVHELAVDEGLDHAVAADGFGLVPFADGVFHGRALHGNGGVFIHAAVFFRLGAFHQKQIALPVVFALNLNAHGPDLVGQLHVDEYAGVVGLGRDFGEAPDDGEKIIAVNLGGTEVADGFAGAMDDAIGHAPGLQRVGVVLHAKSPAGEIPAVE